MCTSSISDNININFVYQWTRPNNEIISGGTNGTLMIFNVGVDDAGQYMCTSTASYTGNEVNDYYVMDSMNTAFVYLIITCKLV